MQKLLGYLSFKYHASTLCRDCIQPKKSFGVAWKRNHQRKPSLKLFAFLNWTLFRVFATKTRPPAYKCLTSLFSIYSETRYTDTSLRIHFHQFNNFFFIKYQFLQHLPQHNYVVLYLRFVLMRGFNSLAFLLFFLLYAPKL